MCNTDVYTDVYPDGRTNKYHRPTFCHRARNGLMCDNPVVYQHPARSLRIGEPTSQYLFPSRPLTPRHSSPSSSPHHRSGSDGGSSDRAARRAKRSSGIYVNGTKVLDLTHKRRSAAPGTSGHRDGAGRERIVIVDAPPTPRTPPLTFAAPYTAPPSPSVGYGATPLAAAATTGNHHHRYSTSGNFIVDAAPSSRPIIVDERPSRRAMAAPIAVEIVSDEGRHRHGNHHRKPHHHSHHDPHHHSRSGSNTSAEERRAARRLTAVELAQHHLRLQQVEAHIRRANDAIRRRPVVPVPSAPTPPPPPATSAAAAAAAAATAAGIASSVPRRANTGVARAKAELDLVDAVRRLDLVGGGGGDVRRRSSRLDAAAVAIEHEQLEAEEEDAREARLRERLMPRRRFTVGPGARRHRVMYEDGMYRWE